MFRDVDVLQGLREIFGTQSGHGVAAVRPLLLPIPRPLGQLGHVLREWPESINGRTVL